MAENRGNPSGTNNNSLPDGVTRNNSSDVFSQRDMQTLKDMSIANLKVVEMIYDITKSKSLKGFGKTIDDLSDSLIKAQQTVDKEAKEIDETLVNYKKQMAKEIQLEEKKKGNQITIAQAYHMLMQTKEAQEFQKTHDRRIEELQKNTEKEYLKTKFKIETKSNELSYLDSKFAKGNNFKAVNNSYWEDLEKLKLSALEIEGGLESKEYKKALMNLNNTYADDMKDAWKKDFKENHKVLGSIAEGIKDTFEKNKEVLRGMLGPLNLIIEPMKDFFGGFGLIFKGIKGGIKSIFGKFTKKNPTSNDVLKSGAFGVGSLYIISEIKKIFGKDSNEKKKGILNKIPIIGKLIPSLSVLLKSIPVLGTFLRGTKLLGKSFGKNALGKGGNLAKFFKSGATKTAFKAMGPMMIVTSLIEMAIDGIKGFFKSKEWGTSKISSALGGFLGGATEGGIKSAFSSMGKWALLGAGIGSVVPVVGTIAGGLIGGAIGGILGAFGGKNLAKGFDSIWKWFKGVFIPSFLEMLDDLFAISKFKQIFKGDGSLGQKIGKSIGLLLSTIFKMPIKLFTTSSAFFKKILNLNNIQLSLSNLIQSVFNGLSNGWQNIKDFGGNVKDKAKEAWEKVKTVGGDVWEGVKESELGEFVSKLFTSLKNGVVEFFKNNPVDKWMDNIMNQVKNFFVSIGAWFSYVGTAFNEGGFDNAIKAITIGTWKKDKKTGLTDYQTYKESLLNPTDVTNVNDAIIKTDGTIIKTNPQDTLVALKDVPLSIDKVREETNKNLNNSITRIEKDGNLEKKLTTIIDVLSKILAKDVQVQLPPQTRNDLDMLMSGGMI